MKRVEKLKSSTWLKYRNGNHPLGHMEALSFGLIVGLESERKRLKRALKKICKEYIGDLDKDHWNKLFPRE